MLIAKKMQGRGHLSSVFRVALVGLPNAGKSTLFNRLAGLADDQAALVSTRPGTTRDWLSHKSRLPGGTSVEWIDTAGWQSASNTIEEQAQSLGRAESEKADLVLICQPVDCEAFSPYSDFVFQSNSQALQLFTCADRPPNPAILDHENAIWVSGLTGAGVAELLEKVEVEAKARGAKVVAPHLARGKEHVEKLVQHLRAAHSLILEEDPVELVAFEVRAAVDELGAVLGNIYSDDLLGRVFSRFCIGK
jgi:tRNA modification GTPase